MSCPNCKDSILNNSGSIIGNSRCNPDCPETIGCADIIPADCVTITRDVACSNIGIGGTLMDYLEDVCNTCCTPPAGGANANGRYGGIIHNDVAEQSIAHVTTLQTLKTYTHDYVGNNAIRVGDIIEVTVLGNFAIQTDPNTTPLFLGLYNGSTPLEAVFMPLSQTTIDVFHSSYLHAYINVTSSTTALVKANYLTGYIDATTPPITNPNITNQSYYKLNVTGIDWTAFNLMIGYQQPTTDANAGFIEEFVVEVKKLIP